MLPSLAKLAGFFISIPLISIIVINCNYILLTKLPWPGDSEGTFWSSSQAATCPPVYHTRRRLHTVPLIAERQTGKFVNTNFYRLWFDPTGNRTRVYHFSSRRFIHSTTDRSTANAMAVKIFFNQTRYFSSKQYVSSPQKCLVKISISSKQN